MFFFSIIFQFIFFRKFLAMAPKLKRQNAQYLDLSAQSSSCSVDTTLEIDLSDGDTELNVVDLSSDESLKAKPSKRSKTAGRSSPSATPPGPKQKPKKFQQNSKNYGLTFSQYTDVKKDMWNRIKGKLGPAVEWCMIASEKHEDGSPHMHLMLAFKQSKRFTTAKWGDFIAEGNHGNYVTLPKPGDVARWCRYLEKEGDWELFGDITPNLYETFCSENANSKSAPLAKNKMVWMRLTEALQGGLTLEQAAVSEDFKSTVAQNVKKLKEYVNFMRSIQLPIDPLDNYRHLSTSTPPEQWTYGLHYLLYWFNHRDHLLNTERPIRARQLYVVAPFGAGKTTLITSLASKLRIYFMPQEDFYCTWEDGKYDLCVIDEFHGNKPVGFLNSWLDGSHLQLKVKGGQTYLKKHNIPTIVFSNFDLDTCYAKALAENKSITAPLKDRFEIISLRTDEVRSLGICTERERVHIINDQVDDNTGCATCPNPECFAPDLDIYAARVAANMGF